MSVYLRGNVYWMDFLFDGKRVQRSTKQGNRQVALEIERAVRSDLSRGKFKLDPEPPPPPPPRHTFGEGLDRLKTQWELEQKDTRQNLSLIKMARADWGPKVMEELTAVHLQEYYVRRAKEEYKTATTNRIVQVLRRTFNLAKKLLKADLQWPDFKMPSEKENARQGFAKPEQMTKVLAELPDDGLRDFVEWCWSTGMRKGEAASLCWSFISDAGLTVPAEFCKSKNPHTIQFGGVLPSIIARCRNRRAFEVNGTTQLSEFIFHRGDGQPISEFRKSWRTACTKAGCGNLLFHDLRRSAVRDLLRAGVSQKTVMKISGHATASIFSRYDIVDGDDVQQALDKAKAYRAG